eukprot:SAG11_NODE_24591_length_371_cov_0.753676_1_plen_64_part_10
MTEYYSSRSSRYSRPISTRSIVRLLRRGLQLAAASMRVDEVTKPCGLHPMSSIIGMPARGREQT